MAEVGSLIAKELVGLFELAAKEGWLDRLKATFRKKHRVLVLGCSGVGKTELLESLTTVTPEVISHLNRTQFAERHRIRIAKEPFVFIDTPGQYESRRLSAIREEISKGLAGIINVVAYGYHETKVGHDEAFLSKSKVSADYLSSRRLLELADLRAWVPLVGAREIANWLITVVTKADLWWDRHNEVLNYYTEGPYLEALDTAKSLNPVIIEHSSVFHKFYGEGPMSGTFDESDRTRARAHLLKTLLAAVARGE
jgi:energy-coupling factor transporter ATP-binding protein EcfA2